MKNAVHDVALVVIGAAIGAVLAAVAVSATFIGQCETKTANAAVASVSAARMVEHKQADISHQVGQQVAAQAVKTQATTNEVIRYVPRLVPMPGDLRYQLSNGWVRVVNAAISQDADSLAAPAREPDGAASGVDPASAATTLAYDFGVCHQAIDGYNGWNTWAKAEGLTPPEKGAPNDR